MQSFSDRPRTEPLLAFSENETPHEMSGDYWYAAGYELTGEHEADRVACMAKALQTGEENDRLSLLDVGCGEARLPSGLSRKGLLGPLVKYVGFDVRQDAITHCHKLFPDNPFCRFFHVGMSNEMYAPEANSDARGRLPLEDASFDLIHCWSIFSHLESADIVYYLREFSRLLRPPGLVFVTFHASEKCRENPTYNPKWWRFEGGEPISPDASKLLVVAYHPDFIRELITANGFRILHEHFPILASNFQTGFYLTPC